MLKAIEALYILKQYQLSMIWKHVDETDVKQLTDEEFVLYQSFLEAHEIADKAIDDVFALCDAIKRGSNG